MFVWLRQFIPASRKAKVIFAVLVLVAIIIIIFLARSAKKPQMQFDAGNVALHIKLRQDEIDRLNQDSDQDGLKDWEEALYHTDPHNPDTDGDGTPDGEEVRLGRDPAKANTSKDPKKPNDYFPVSTPLTDSGGLSTGSTKNITADFTRTFLRGPLAQLLAGDKPDIDTKAVEQYADKLKGGSVLADTQQFTTKDIKINPTTGDQVTIQYFNAVQDIFRVLNMRGRNELDIVAEALTNQDYGGLVELAPYQKAYQKAINSLKTLVVPNNLVDYHLTLLNYLSHYKRSAGLLQRLEDDPILGVLIINERLHLDDEISTALNRYKKKIAVDSNK